MKHRIVYLNTFGWGNGHEMFNSSLLAMCIELAGNKPVLCRSTKSNFGKITRLLSSNAIDYSSVNFKAVCTISGQGCYALLARYILGALLSLWYLLISKKTDLIFIPFNNLFALKHINQLNRLLGRSIVIFCHGEMEFTASDINKRGLLSVQLYNRCRSFFLSPKVRVTNGLHFSVLGAKIKENLKSYIPFHIWEHFVVMDHPYLFSFQPASKTQNHQRLRLGTCGAMNYSKGALEMAIFAQKCHQNKLDVSITHIGKVLGGLKELQQSGIDIPSAYNELSREKYDRLIASLDFILFFYSQSNYKITASGAIMDAIAMRRPIVAIRNDYFEYIFEKFGPFGYLVDSIEQMEDIVQLLCENKLPTVFDFDHLQAKFTPKALLIQLQAIVAQIQSRKK